MQVDEQTRYLDAQPGALVRVTPYADGSTELVMRNNRSSMILRLTQADRAAVVAMMNKPTPQALPPRQTLYITVSVPAPRGKDHFECEVLPNGRVSALEEGAHENDTIRFVIPDGIEPTETLLTAFLMAHRDGVRLGEKLGAEDVKLSLRSLLGVPSQEMVTNQLGRLRLSIEGEDD